MPLENLNQNQKNYLLMLLMGGDLPENEIRMFLARSGWPIDAIDAGVLYSKDEGLIRTLAEARGMSSVEANTVTSDINKVTLDDAKSTINKDIDPYRETAETAAQEFSVIAPLPPAMPTAPLLDGIKQPQKTVFQSETVNTTPAIMTMPEVPKASMGNAVLKTVAWFLFILLILMTTAVLGYMYFTGTGIFGEVTYNRLNLNA